jgi:alpha-beta hydrolase superfamily lysophospholipase
LLSPWCRIFRGIFMFDVAAARAALKPMDWALPAEPQAALRDYVRHYGLDFGGHIAGLRHGIGYIDVSTVLPSDYRIAVQTFQVPKPRGTVLVMHGYFDHVGIFDHVIEHLLGRDFDVVSFDLPGHGLSSGAPAAINSFSEYQHVLDAVLAGVAQTRLAVPLSVVAQSTGGAIIMEWLLRSRATPDSSPFAAVVTFAPLVRPVNWAVNRTLYLLLRLFRRYIARKFAVNSHDADFLDFLRNRDPLQSRDLSVLWVGAMKRWIPHIENATPCTYPLVVVQGDEDGTVDWRHNLGVIRAKFPDVQVHMIATGRHQLANEAPALREQALAVLDRALPRADTD